MERANPPDPRRLVEERLSLSPLRVFASSEAGPLYEAIQSEQHTVPTAATLVWQVVQRTDALREALRQAGARRRNALEALVVPAGGYDSFALLVFDTSAEAPDPVPFEVKPTLPDLERAYIAARQAEIERSFARIVDRVGSDGLPSPAMRLELLSPGLLVDLVHQAPLQGLLLHPPEWEESGAAIPTPAWRVELPNGASASVGVQATRQGREGVTTVRHLFGRNGIRPVPGATATLVDPGGARIPLVIEAEDAVTDSVFLAYDTTARPAVPWTLASGLLQGMTPRQYEQASFDGAASGPDSAVILGWSPDLPFVLPESQLKVVTELKTAEGDSGAALLDSNRNLAGFAFARTAYGQVPAMSSWIWAHSVTEALSLDP